MSVFAAKMDKHCSPSPRKDDRADTRVSGRMGEDECIVETSSRSFQGGMYKTANNTGPDSIFPEINRPKFTDPGVDE